MAINKRRAEAIRKAAESVFDNAESLIEMFESPGDYNPEDKEDAITELESSIRLAVKEWEDIE